MAKVKDLNVKGAQEVKPEEKMILDEQGKSMIRSNKLIQNVFKSISETAQEMEEEFTVFEINTALLKIANHYNNEGLKAQFKQKSKK